MIHHYPFELQPLPYLYDALEPRIDMETMYFHHTKHLRTYVDLLNQALVPYPEYHNYTLEQLLFHLPQLPEELQKDVQKYGGGVYNHEFFFDSMIPTPQQPHLKIREAILLDFFSVEQFQDTFTQMALDLFGSGYLWLVSDDRGKLAILSLPDQSTPLTGELYPLLNLDLWEHSYYLKHQNRRADYIANWFPLINWKEVNRRYQQALLSIALQHKNNVL